jgi:hypothetical protein
MKRAPRKSNSLSLAQVEDLLRILLAPEILQVHKSAFAQVLEHGADPEVIGRALAKLGVTADHFPWLREVARDMGLIKADKR